MLNAEEPELIGSMQMGMGALELGNVCAAFAFCGWIAGIMQKIKLYIDKIEFKQ